MLFLIIIALAVLLFVFCFIVGAIERLSMDRPRREMTAEEMEEAINDHSYTGN